MKGANRYMEILLVVFPKKKLIWGNLIFLGHFLLFDWTWLKLSQATLTMDLYSGHDFFHAYYWILKQPEHD